MTNNATKQVPLLPTADRLAVHALARRCIAESVDEVGGSDDWLDQLRPETRTRVLDQARELSSILAPSDDVFEYALWVLGDHPRG